MTELGKGAEFDLIRALRARWGKLAVGLGDDASVLAVTRGDRLVVSVDAAFDRVHFRTDWFSFREIGYRAVTAALSDLAAMAARPTGVLIALALPRNDERELLEIADGIADAVSVAGTVILGGNLARADVLSLSTTVLGEAHAPLGRDGVQPGDCLYVTGELGGPRAALRALSGKHSPSPALRQRLVRPVARIAEARWLAGNGAVAAVDVSDGLAADAGHLAAASRVGIELRSDAVPVFPGATPDDALAGGEEFELLVASRTPIPVSDFVQRFGVPLTLIGEASNGQGVQLLRDGERVAPPTGYDHFST